MQCVSRAARLLRAASATHAPRLLTRAGVVRRNLSTASSTPPTSAAIAVPPSAPVPVPDPEPSNVTEVASEDISLSSLLDQSADVLEQFHAFHPLPWSATLPLAALTLRLTTLPVMYHSQLHGARAAIAAKAFPTVQAFSRRTKGNIWQKYLTWRRLRSLTLRATNTSSWRLFPWMVVTHVPLVIWSSLTIREVSTRAPDGWTEGGLWFSPDLSVADPTGVLPLATTALWLLNMDPGRTPTAPAADAPSSAKVEYNLARLRGGFGTTLQIVSVAALTVTSTLPAGLILFWLTNGILTMTLRGMFRSDGLRAVVGLPTSEQVQEASPPSILPAVRAGMGEARKQLSTVQREIGARFAKRVVDDDLVKDVRRMLRREWDNGRIGMRLTAVLRHDETSGRAYVAVVTVEEAAQGT